MSKFLKINEIIYISADKINDFYFNEDGESIDIDLNYIPVGEKSNVITLSYKNYEESFAIFENEQEFEEFKQRCYRLLG